MNYQGSRVAIIAAIGLFVGGLALVPTTARAATFTEYFNDYGTTNQNLSGRNGGTGWSGAWTGNTAVQYVAGAQAVYSATGYSSAGNDTGSNDGAVRGGGTPLLANRTMSLTGTIWYSAVVTQTATGVDTLLWLDKADTVTTGTTREFVSLRGSTGLTGGAGTPPEPEISYEGTDDNSSSTDLAINTPHLVLLRIDINYSGALDRIRYWIDPNLSGGEAGLGLTVGSTNGPKYAKSSLDAYGATFDGIGISTTSSGNTVDAIRLSNEADGFIFVTTGVPEPLSAASLTLGAAGLLLRRQRA